MATKEAWKCLECGSTKCFAENYGVTCPKCGPLDSEGFIVVDVETETEGE